MGETQPPPFCLLPSTARNMDGRFTSNTICTLDQGQQTREGMDAIDKNNSGARLDAETLLRDYYAKFNVDFDSLLKQSEEDDNASPKRFLRLNPRFEESETLNLLKAELPDKSPFPRLIDWMDTSSFGKFFCVPGNFRIAQSKAYKTGRIYGQDISSGAAVFCLLQDLIDSTRPNNSVQDKTNDNDEDKSTSEPFRVLDLCCAPGLKLCALADWLEQNFTQTRQAPPVVVGVDLHGERLDITKNVIRKYQLDVATRGKFAAGPHPEKLPRIRLYKGDGTTFDSTSGSSTTKSHELVFDTKADWEEILHAGPKQARKRHNKSSRARERKRLRLLQDQDEGVDRAVPHSVNTSKPKQLYDRVLVDAECSTDGSLKHVQKILKRQETSSEKGSGPANSILSCLQDERKMDELVLLQERLACNGFRLLRPGGLMVYSTCSLSERQNEEVVRSLLAKNENGRLVPIDRRSMGSTALVVEGSLPGTVRFLPNTGNAEEFYGGGFFVAKIQKIPGLRV